MQNTTTPWVSFTSNDLEQVRNSVSNKIKAHQLSQLRADQRLNTRVRYVQFGQVGLSRLGYGADVHIEPEHLSGFYLVQIPQYGTARIRCGAQVIDSSPDTATILNPNEDVDMVWHANNESLMLKIERTLVEQNARALGLNAGSQGMVFPARLLAHTQPSWQIMMRYLLDCARNAPDILNAPLIVSQLEQLTVSTLLSLHPPLQSCPGPFKPGQILPRHLKKVEDYLQAHAHLPVTLEDLSQEAGVSARTLQQAFRSHYGVSPMQYLKQVRLDKLRDELLGSGDTRLSLADLAMRWGFAHQGRFSAEYRQRFGEAPSITLQRLQG